MTDSRYANDCPVYHGVLYSTCKLPPRFALWRPLHRIAGLEKGSRVTGDVLERGESFERIGIRGGGDWVCFGGVVFGFFGFGGIGDARFMTAFLIGICCGWLAVMHLCIYLPFNDDTVPFDDSLQ